MPVYRRHRLVHVHIPKTAGTAVELLFRDLDGSSDNGHEWIGEGYHANRWFEYQHLTAGELAVFAGRVFAEFDRFAIVRDPYQRLISDHLWRQTIATHFPDSFVPSHNTFEEFLAAIPTDVDDGWDVHAAGAQRGRANLLIHVRPQHHFLRARNGDPDPSIEVLAFEALPDALDRFLAARGLRNERVQRTSSRPLANFFTPETLRSVNERYERDFITLGYPIRTSVEP